MKFYNPLKTHVVKFGNKYAYRRWLFSWIYKDLLARAPGGQEIQIFSKIVYPMNHFV